MCMNTTQLFLLNQCYQLHVDFADFAKFQLPQLAFKFWNAKIHPLKEAKAGNTEKISR